MNKEMIQDFKQHEGDTGSVEVQVVQLTEDIKRLTEHFKTFPKDANSRRGLMKKVGQRSRFLRYLKKKNEAVYKQLLTRLGIRG